jgi:hypothetical protein
MNDLLSSRPFRIGLLSLGGFLLLLIGFAFGVSVGEQKEQHFAQRNQNFQGMFVPRPQGMMTGSMPIGRVPLPSAHGVFGRVLTVSWPSIVIEGVDQTEQEVIVTDATQIRAGRGGATVDQIKPGAMVAVFGIPNANGQIEAQLIRLTSN